MKKKQKTYWAGFYNGKLDWREMNNLFDREYYVMVPCIYKTKEEAKIYYGDVRRIKIVEVKK